MYFAFVHLHSRFGFGHRSVGTMFRSDHDGAIFSEIWKVRSIRKAQSVKK